MPARLSPADPEAVAETLARPEWAPADLKLLTRHFLALLADRAPGRSVEVRVPPYAAAQVVEGVRHTRGTPPAVVETDPQTWIALATGGLDWAAAVDEGRVRASGERTDLSAYLPLVDTTP
ncbi:sterol carrier family protein [Nocardioides sp.]|uniref:sterol carrier family protein n=1 Tax=Nocardioides sp. TaxID=35761 RepID=UPI002D7ECA7C|nr:sterol carrier family protein [Nocardioides sp.]HET8960112.1 sterol carrier family protein [Nocardioides sp.]